MRMPGAFHLIGVSTGLEEYRRDAATNVLIFRVSEIAQFRAKSSKN